MAKPEKHVFICTQQRPQGHPRGSCGADRDAFSVFATFSMELDQRGLYNKVMLTSTGCMGPCNQGVNVLVYPEGIMYGGVRQADIPAIIDEHLVGGKPVESLLMPAEHWG